MNEWMNEWTDNDLEMAREEQLKGLLIGTANENARLDYWPTQIWKVQRLETGTSFDMEETETGAVA